MSHTKSLFLSIENELSGESAQQMTADLTRFYRSVGSSGYHRANDYILNKLTSFGLEVERETYALDGKSRYGSHTAPLAWEPFSAELTLMTPEVSHLVSFDEAPSCLVWWSCSTSPEGEVYDVIDVGTGEHRSDFEGKDIKGKAVFARGTADTDSWESWMRVANLAREFEAAGVITDYLLRQAPPERTRENFVDAVQLLRFPEDFRDLWGISIDYSASQKLTRALEQGTASVYANVQCRTFEGTAVNITGTIPGAELPEESVYINAHVTAGTKPGGNCAEGIALALEVARVFQVLIDAGTLPRPRRNLKFIFIPENLGSSYLFATHPETVDETLMAFNYCSVGHAQDKTRCVLMFYRVPDSIPSFVNDFCELLMEESPKEVSWVGKKDRSLPRISFVQVPYIARSDNGVWNEHRVPTPMIMSSPDLYFHTQFLTADKSDPAVFRRSGLMTAAAAYAVANADETTAEAIIARILFRTLANMGTAYSNAVSAQQDPKRRLAHIVEQTRGKMDSVLRLVRSDGPDVLTRVRESTENAMDLLVSFSDRLQQQIDARLTEVSTETMSQQCDRSPERVVGAYNPGVVVSYNRLVTMAEAIQKEDPTANFALMRPLVDEVWNFIDGRRDVSAIRDAVCYEFDVEIPEQLILELILALEQAGFVNWQDERKG